MKHHLDKLHSLNLSPSSINSFLYNKDSWFESYIVGTFTDSLEMQFGRMIDLKIQNDPLFLPHLPRYEKMQERLCAVLSGIKLVGKPDGFNLTDPKKLYDYKTGRNAWTQEKVNDCIQLKFYLLLIYITYKIPPEDFTCGIHWLPTKREDSGDFNAIISFIDEKDIKTFSTKYTMQDILSFIKFIKKIYKEMEQFCLQYGSK